MNMPACRSPIGCICRRNGPRMPSAARRHVFPRRSNSRPSRRLRSISSAPPARPAYRVVSCWTVRTAPIRRAAERPEETLLIEWPEGEDAPTKYWLSTVDKNISFRALVDLAKMRWRVERDYQELKQVVGLGHYEGRSWPGFHHHGYASRSTDSWSPKGRRFPPQD